MEVTAVAGIIYHATVATLGTGVAIFWLLHVRDRAGQLYFVGGLIGGINGWLNVAINIPGWSPATWAALSAMFGWAALLSAPFGIAVMWLWPRRVRFRSGEGLVLTSLTVFWAAQLYLFVFERAWYHAAPGSLRDFLIGAASYPGSILFILALLLQGRRGYEVGGGDGRAAVVLTSFIISQMAGLAYTITGFAAGEMGLAAPYRPAQLFGGVPGDPFRLATVGWFALRAAIVGFAVYHALRRNWIPVYVFGIMLVVGALGFATPYDLFAAVQMAGAALVSYVIMKHGAWGVRDLPPATALVLSATIGVAVFVTLNTVILTIDPANPLILITALVVGTTGGLVTTLTLHPRAARLPFIRGNTREGDTSTTRERIEPYHAVLVNEFATGTPREAIFEKLRPLRTTLGISDHEHAILEYAAGPATALRLSERDVKPGALFLGRYRVGRVLGSGGLGVAHLAEDERVGRAVVLKTLRAGAGGAASLDSLLKEARALGRVSHPNVVTLIDADRVGEEAFIVMEHVDGGSLADRLRAGGLPRGDVGRLADDVLAGLEAVHGAGLVHRDVKPSNVLLTREGRAKLADFGVAHLPGFETTAADGGGGAVGTVRYMAPEQARGRPAIAASDLYAAGLVLYEAWTGTPYHEVRPGDGAVEVQMRVAAGHPFDRAIAAPDALVAWFRRALAPSPADRFGTAREMREALAVALA